MSSKRQKKLQARKNQTLEEQEDEIEYVPRDAKVKITWPRTLAGIDDSKFICIWPNNINSKKTIIRGRRIAKEAGCEDPLVHEMSEVCQYYKLTHVVEPYKQIPRDFNFYPGRIKVQLVDENGKIMNQEVPNRRSLMLKMGELIPKLASRKKKQQQDHQAGIGTSGTLTTGAAGGNKKKGKKKGRR